MQTQIQYGQLAYEAKNCPDMRHTVIKKLYYVHDLYSAIIIELLLVLEL